MEYHAIEDEYAWSRTDGSLGRTVKAGVEVRVFYDDMGSIGFVNLSLRENSAKGIACPGIQSAASGITICSLNNRDHRKITVIDGKVSTQAVITWQMSILTIHIHTGNGRIRTTGRRCGGFAYGSILEMWESIREDSGRWDVLDIDGTEKYLVQHPYQAKADVIYRPYADCPVRRNPGGRGCLSLYRQQSG